MLKVLEFLLPEHGSALVRQGGEGTLQHLAEGTLTLTNKGQYVFKKVNNPASSGRIVASRIAAAWSKNDYSAVKSFQVRDCMPFM
mgnify:CR=1 FL=1